MGELISLPQRRAARARQTSPAVRGRVAFFFDLASPWTYLAAERVDRQFDGVRWRPALAQPVAPLPARRGGGLRRAAQERAGRLAMPLVWPDGWPPRGLAAMRVATLAVQRARGAQFVLAATRLAFCGGYDLADPEIVAEAAAIAGLGLDECLAAAGAGHRDLVPQRRGRWLSARGADALPVLVVGRTLYAGEDRLAEAVAANAARPGARVAMGGRAPRG